jgi:hypothetical protein
MDEYQAGDAAEEPTPPPSVEAAPEPAPVLSGVSREGFRIDDWSGFPNYHCPVCDVAWLNPNDVIDHILQMHPDYA